MTCRVRVSRPRRLRDERRASELIESRGSSAATTKMSVGTASTGSVSVIRPSSSSGTTTAIAHVVQRVGGTNGDCRDDAAAMDHGRFAPRILPHGKNGGGRAGKARHICYLLSLEDTELEARHGVGEGFLKGNPSTHRSPLPPEAAARLSEDPSSPPRTAVPTGAARSPAAWPRLPTRVPPRPPPPCARARH